MIIAKYLRKISSFLRFVFHRCTHIHWFHIILFTLLHQAWIPTKHLNWLKNMSSTIIMNTEKYLRWSPETIQAALKMYVKLGTTGYQDLCEQIPAYPSLSTLRNHIKNLDCSPGVQHDILKLLEMKTKMHEILTNHESFCFFILL